MLQIELYENARTAGRCVVDGIESLSEFGSRGSGAPPFVDSVGDFRVPRDAEPTVFAPAARFFIVLGHSHGTYALAMSPHDRRTMVPKTGWDSSVH